MKYVNKEIKKIDSHALTMGKPVYTDDMAPANCLIVGVLHSPHAHAIIKSFDLKRAKRVDGIACILTYEDMPRIRFTAAGESFPEPSAYDRYVLENKVRYVGDFVAIVAGESQAAVDDAISKIKVEYEILPAILDFESALDSDTIIHPEDDYSHQFPVGDDRMRNLAFSDRYIIGDIDKAFDECDVIMEDTFYTKANSQCPMETPRTYSYMDYENRLTVVSSTQVPFHCRKAIARAFDIPQSRVRVIKPRIGGGFGLKQSINTEILCSAVTLHTGLPAKLVFSRNECFTSTHSRHEMRMQVKMGATDDGIIKAVSLTCLSNAGAYGDHAGTTASLVGQKSLPLCGRADSYLFDVKTVYTNTMTGGAFRGFGATQGIYAVQSMAYRIAKKLDIDPIEFLLKNIPQELDEMPAYPDGPLSSSALDRCIKRGSEMMDWKNKYPCRRISDHTVRGVGVALSMQGSAIAVFDNASATINLNDKGFYSLHIGATDMGTGCDTILSQIAADVLMCDMDKIIVTGVDTDTSPYDTGSYASSTTFLTGMAVVKAANELIDKMKLEAGRRLSSQEAEISFDGETFCVAEDCSKSITLDSLGENSAVCDGKWMTATQSHSNETSPPPFIATFVEVEIDTQTGEIDVVDCVGVVDCGTVINPNLAAIQAEGGIAQGIGMALYEDVRYNNKGKMINSSYMNYKIPSRLDIPNIRIAFESSYENLGPFGAKSIGEVVINGSAPAINNAILAATGIEISSLPILPENMLMGLVGHGK